MISRRINTIKFVVDVLQVSSVVGNPYLKWYNVTPVKDEILMTT